MMPVFRERREAFSSAFQREENKEKGKVIWFEKWLFCC